VAILTESDLNTILPNGTTRYVALFTELPAEGGTGGTEATGGGYARVSVSAWINETIDGTLFRKNVRTVEFETQTADLSGIVGWGVYTASSGGSLLAFGPIVDLNGDAVTETIAVSRQARFLEQNLFVGGEDLSSQDAHAELDIVDEIATRKLQALLPPGAAWPRDADTELTKLVRALSYEFTRVKQRGLDLLDENDPRTVTEMIDDYERVYGLTTQGDLATRRAALHGKMLGFLSPSIPNIISIAAGLGYVATVEEYDYTEMFSCISPCNYPLYTRQWMYVWVVTTPSGAADSTLTDVLESITPLHTILSMNFT
jgi:uncharacterized protein YmfQ (DUF2313 family)